MDAQSTLSITPMVRQLATYIRSLHVWTIPIVLAFYFVVEAVYNVFFHPLAKFPGPPLAGMSRWWRAYKEMLGDKNFSEVLFELHAQYGDIVRIGPNELHFAKPAAYHELYNMRNRWDKDPRLYSTSLQGISLFHLKDYRAAKRRRDPVMPLFSRSSILSLQHMIQDNAEVFCKAWAETNSQGRSTDLLLAMQAFTFETITTFCFGTSFDALRAPNFDHPVTRTMRQTVPVITLLKHFHFLTAVFERIPAKFICFLNPDLKPYYSFVETVERHIENIVRNPQVLANSEHPTIFHAFLDDSNPERLTARSLCAEAHLLMFAGTDTTSNALTVGTMNVLDNKEIHDKLTKELREAWPDLLVRPRFEDLEKLPYLKAVICESLRFTGGVPSPLGRVVPPEGAMVSDMWIPGGTVAATSNFMVHYNESVFPDPYCFKPERWLDPGSESLDQWLVAFHRGPRSCLGINLAYCELYIVFANVFRRFDLSLDGVRAKDIAWKEHYLPHYVGPSLKITARPVAI